MRRLSVALFLMSALMTGMLSAQSVEECLNKHTESLGGEETIESVNTIVVQGIRYQDESQMKFTLYRKGAEKFRYETTRDGQTRTMGHDGKDFWRDGDMQQNGPDGGQMERPGGEGRSGGRMGGRMGGRSGGMPPGGRPGGQDGRRRPGGGQTAIFDVKTPLYHAWKDGHELKVKGKAFIDGVETIRIEGKDDDKNVSEYFVDARDFTLIRSARERKFRDMSIKTETTFSDFVDVDGIMMPHAINQRTITSRGERVSDTVVAAIEINTDLDDKLFEKPAQ